jgi:hypothetical protein
MGSSIFKWPPISRRPNVSEKHRAELKSVLDHSMMEKPKNSRAKILLKLLSWFRDFPGSTEDVNQWQTIKLT